MPTTLEVPVAVHDAPLLPANMKEASTNTPLPVEAVQTTIQPILSPLDRLARDFPVLFMLAISY
jgi:hypothetical protein